MKMGFCLTFQWEITLNTIQSLKTMEIGLLGYYQIYLFDKWKNFVVW